MQNIYKYSFFTELEKKYNNYFKLANEILLLPPILKKIGLLYYLAFLVIENSATGNIKRPIGVIVVNRLTGQEKIYDMADYEFCKTKMDYEQTYYNINLSPNCYPNKTPELEENFKVSLDLLGTSLNNKFLSVDSNVYQKYLTRIKKMFPQNYNVFFDELEKNEIVLIDDEIKHKREISKITCNHTSSQLVKQKLIENVKFKRQFKNNFRKLIAEFIKKQILPSLRGLGSYAKLNFYYEFGRYYKNFEKNIATKNYDCYAEEIEKDVKVSNTQKLLSNEKTEVKKILTSSKSLALDDSLVDTLGKVIIVFLNAMLVEEIHNGIITLFEEEITECINIFNENSNKEFNSSAKEFLYNVFDDLLCDYNTASNDKLSNIYYAYLVVNFPFSM